MHEDSFLFWPNIVNLILWWTTLNLMNHQQSDPSYLPVTRLRLTFSWQYRHRQKRRPHYLNFRSQQQPSHNCLTFCSQHEKDLGKLYPFPTTILSVPATSAATDFFLATVDWYWSHNEHEWLKKLLSSLFKKKCNLYLFDTHALTSVGMCYLCIGISWSDQEVILKITSRSRPKMRSSCMDDMHAIFKFAGVLLSRYVHELIDWAIITALNAVDLPPPKTINPGVRFELSPAEYP